MLTRKQETEEGHVNRPIAAETERHLANAIIGGGGSLWKL